MQLRAVLPARKKKGTERIVIFGSILVFPAGRFGGLLQQTSLGSA